MKKLRLKLDLKLIVFNFSVVHSHLCTVSFLIIPAVVNIDGDIFILYHNLLFHTAGFKIVQLKTLKAFVGGVCYMYK